ncbi:phage integrase family site specific recombinase [Campylobacter hyointestinalis]|uniref:tyrosine-type recombinase/integrase n=1 Tax=Campylobacter hyointestinalis TaxID=198 RepID=UPI00072B89D6|nr:tyrosine-type recombinase/integrase [Campylobacter hyointestinalis]CUU70589.1 phage integrase family site specific recombinase [Campylobacter hyointestinalis]
MIINGIFKYALALGVVEANPTPTTSVFYNNQRVTKPRSALTEPTDIKELIHSINTYKNPIVRNALFFTMLTAQRQNQILNLKWSDIEVKNDITFIRFNSEIMKMKRTQP